MGNEIVVLFKPKFYIRYLDGIFNQRKKNVEDIFFRRLNNYHQYIKPTIEISPPKLLDTKSADGIYKTTVHRKTTKFQIHWSSEVPKRYKYNIWTIILVIQSKPQ